MFSEYYVSNDASNCISLIREEAFKDDLCIWQHLDRAIDFFKKEFKDNAQNSS